MYKKICGCLFFLGVTVLLPTTVVFAENVQFSTVLRRGSTGQDILRLQEFLKTMPDVYPEGLVTGYFGTFTEKAVKRFQGKYNISPIGVVGPRTRAQLNKLIGQKSQAMPPLEPKTSLVPSPEKQQLLPSCPTDTATNCRITETTLRTSRIISVIPLLQPQSAEQDMVKKEAKAPVLKNLGVSFEPWDKNTNRAGAFIFLPAENKLFLEYGVEVASSEGGTKILPTFEYRIAADADVFAAMDGIVTNITYKEGTRDYSILIQPELNSEWTLGHDHVRHLKVSKGDAVKAGNILGKAGTLGGELGRTEIMFWGPGVSSTRVNTYCPFKYFAPELLLEYQQKVLRHMKDWEEFKGNVNLYNEEKHIFPGCIYETLLD